MLTKNTQTFACESVNSLDTDIFLVVLALYLVQLIKNETVTMIFEVLILTLIGRYFGCSYYKSYSCALLI